MSQVVLFSKKQSHIDFASFIARELNKNLLIENEIENLNKENINIVPDYLSLHQNVSEDSIILDTGSIIKPKFSTLVCNVDSAKTSDYENFLLHLDLLKFSKVQEILIKNSTDKYSVVNFFKDILVSEDINKQILTDILQVLDETIMNAIFDAQKLNIPRSISFELERPVKVEWALEKSMFYFKVIDQWGSLDKEKVFNHLNQNLEEYQIDHSYHGAGLGLYRSFFIAGASMKFQCIPNKNTSVSCLFKLKKKNRDFKKQLKFFSVN